MGFILYKRGTCMDKFVIISDSFKGSMDSISVCKIISSEVKNVFPCCETVIIPVADGGEGTVDCFYTALGGSLIELTVVNPFFEDITVEYLILANGETAVIEVASCIGLPLVEDRKDPIKASSYGVGQILLDAINRGCKKIIIGLGGSSTNDGGVGMAAALGVKFFNQQNQSFVPIPENIDRIASIDVSDIQSKIKDIEFIAMCDVNNPLCGINGASHVFGPQKGATEEMVRILDNKLYYLKDLIRRDLDKIVSNCPGAGAAGGLGAGVLAFLNGTLKQGIQVVLDLVGFDEQLKNADMVFTGEGKLDSQSLRGKVIQGVCLRSKKHGVPVIAFVGMMEPNMDQIYEDGLVGAFTIGSGPRSLPEAFAHSKEDLALTAHNVLSVIRHTEERAAALHHYNVDSSMV